MTSLSDHKLVQALCLDWDGTIRRPISGGTFIKDADDIELIPGIEDRIWQYRDRGYLIIGISNQGAVAHGIKTIEQINAEMDATFKLFKRNPFHSVKMSYHHEQGNIHPYCHRSLLRKPDHGMLAIAEVEAFEHGYVIDWNNSLFVGDMLVDKQCAERAAMHFMWAEDFLKTEPLWF